MAQQTQTVHPHLFFDSNGLNDLRSRILETPRLNLFWERFRAERVPISFNLQVTEEGILDTDTGRNYGDALADLTIAYIVLQDTQYRDKVIDMMVDLAGLSNWGNFLAGGHIEMGYALAWDVLYYEIPQSAKELILNGVRSHGALDIPNDVSSNVNWTASAATGLLGLAFAGDGDASFNSFVGDLLRDAKLNFKEDDRNVLWGHGTDGFPHEGLGYWRKYVHVGLFFKALRYYQPQNDWFHLGKEYPGSEFLRKTGYPRIYADVQAPGLATLTWGDSRQVRTKPDNGPWGNIALLTLIASEYKDGYVLDFIDYLLMETQVGLVQEDWATFVFYDDSGVPAQSYRELPLSRYWPDMEAAIFRSGWQKDDLVFFMKCGSPGGHGRVNKLLSPGTHDHPDANGFTIFYNNDYLAAEDGALAHAGPDEGKQITYGHNTILVDNQGQKGDKTEKVLSTLASMDYLDAPHVGYLLGDATDAYEGLARFHRHVIYKKHKYIVMLDELRDDVSHAYEYLLGMDSRHAITQVGENEFMVIPTQGKAEMSVVFLEPQQSQNTIEQERPYAIDISMTDLLRLSPARDLANATFFSLLYPRRIGEPLPEFEKIYLDSAGMDVTALRVDGDEYHLYNFNDAEFSFRALTTDAQLCYFKDNFFAFEYLTTGGTEFLYHDRIGIRSSSPVVAAFQGMAGKIRVGGEIAPGTPVEVTLLHPRLTGAMVDGQRISPLRAGPGWLTFSLERKSYKIGPSGAEQEVVDNYAIELTADPLMTLLAPNAGELLAVDSSFTISWESDSSVSAVSLAFSPDFGRTWQNIADNLTKTDTFNWVIPDQSTNGGLIRVANADGGVPQDISDMTFSIDKPPMLLSFRPQNGVPGDPIVLNGRNLKNVSAVAIGGVLAESVVVASDTTLGVIVPNSVQTGRVTIFNAIGSDTSDAIFIRGALPEILRFEPARGTVGQQIGIIGSGLSTVSTVSLAEVPVTTFALLSDSLLSIIIPSGARTGKVALTNHVGTTLSDQDLVVKLPPKPPNITQITPKAGPVGSLVELQGSGLSDVLEVKLAQIVADSIVFSADTALQVVIPDGARSGRWSVTTIGGSAVSEQIFTVTDSMATDTGQNTSEIVREFSLDANYPNPFNGSTTILYSIPEAIEVKLAIYNLLGQRVRILVDRKETSGRKSAQWQGNDDNGQLVSSGIYVARLEAGGRVFSRKVILQK